MGLLLVCLLIVFVIANVSNSIWLSLPNGSWIRVKPASLLQKVAGGTCKIATSDNSGTSGTVLLNDNLVSGPYVVLPDNGKVIYCVYDLVDMGLFLLKFETDKKFTNISQQKTLTEIVQSSSWKVTMGTTDDWRKISELVDSMPPNEFRRICMTGIDFGIVRSHGHPERVISQINANASDQPILK